MRYKVMNVANSARGSQFEIDSDQPPAVGQIIVRGSVAYRVLRVFAGRIIEVERVVGAGRFAAPLKQ